MKLVQVKFVILLVLFSACGLPIPATEPIQTEETSQKTETLPSQEVISQTPSISPSPGGAVVLQIWLPPEFDPASGSVGGEILQNRLEDFSKRRPGVRVEVRIKDVYGPGGLLDSLTTATAAAPLAVPDLIAFPRDLLEAAALKGLLKPFDNLTNSMDQSDWYPFAQQLAHLQESIYGLPFAGDALAQVYRPSVIPIPPKTWTETLEITTPLVFPAADPQALSTISLYQANNGAIRDDQSRPFLDATLLSEVLNFYAQAEEAGVMPYWLTQYQEDAQIWETFQDKSSDLVVTWTSNYLQNLTDDIGIAPIPTPDGQPYTSASGWVWALATNQAEHQELSVELVEYLTDPDFLAMWTQTAGYLPTRSNVLDGWEENSSYEILHQILSSSRLIPPADVISSLGDPLLQATIQVLKQQTSPISAAQSAAASLTEP